jgi:hypothetical protein
MAAPRPESIADQVVAKKKKRLTADEPRVPTGGGINTNYGPQQPDGRIWQEKLRDGGNSAINYALGPHAQSLMDLSQFSDAADMQDAAANNLELSNAAKDGRWWDAAKAAPWAIGSSAMALIPGASIGPLDNMAKGTTSLADETAKSTKRPAKVRPPGAPINPRVKIGHNMPPPDLNLENTLQARADQMNLPPNQRIQPDPNRRRVLDTNYQQQAPVGPRTDLAANYPRNPNPNAQLPKGDRGRVLVDRKTEIAARLAEKIKARGLIGTDVQYFYSSDGPIYRAAMKAGLSHDEAVQYLNDFAQHYAATSPRTDTTQNLRNATLSMAKQAANIPHRQVMGPGTETKGVKGISEKGYPMMTGKGGIHGGLLDSVISGEGINNLTNPKPSTFGGNMSGNLSGVTADTHAIRGVLMALNEIDPGSVPDSWLIPEHIPAYRADHTKLNPSMINDTLASQMIGPRGATTSAQTEYPVIADIWHEVARVLGVEPAEAQALGWFSLGDETNLGSQLATVGELMDQRINVTSQAMQNSPEDVARALFRRQIPLMGVAGAGGAMGLGAMSNSDQQQEPRRDVY